MRPCLPSLATIAIAIGACADLSTEPQRHASEPLRQHVADATAFGDLQLLSCPTAQTRTARAVIGPLGGTVGAGGSSIRIPPAVVLIPTAFEITVPASRYMEVEIHAVGADSYRFLLPATVTISYKRCPEGALPPAVRAQGVYIDDVSKQVLELMGGLADKADQEISFQTAHLSGYAVAYSDSTYRPTP
jgi:hypothetical protein